MSVGDSTEHCALGRGVAQLVAALLFYGKRRYTVFRKAVLKHMKLIS